MSNNSTGGPGLFVSTISLFGFVSLLAISVTSIHLRTSEIEGLSALIITMVRSIMVRSIMVRSIVVRSIMVRSRVVRFVIFEL